MKRKGKTVVGLKEVTTFRIKLVVLVLECTRACAACARCTCSLFDAFSQYRMTRRMCSQIKALKPSWHEPFVLRGGFEGTYWYKKVCKL